MMKRTTSSDVIDLTDETESSPKRPRPDTLPPLVNTDSLPGIIAGPLNGIPLVPPFVLPVAGNNNAFANGSRIYPSFYPVSADIRYIPPPLHVPNLANYLNNNNNNNSNSNNNNNNNNNNSNSNSNSNSNNNNINSESTPNSANPLGHLDPSIFQEVKFPLNIPPYPYPIPFGTATTPSQLSTSSTSSSSSRPLNGSYSSISASTLFTSPPNSKRPGNNASFTFHPYSDQRSTFNGNYQSTYDRTAATPVMIDLSNINDEDEDEVYFGNVRVLLVGLQYYHGNVNKGENVTPIREHDNPHDTNAIAVFNMFQQQVGHLDKSCAAVFSPLIDIGKLRIEGLIPAPKGAQKMPLIVQCYGKVSDRDHVMALLKPLGLEVGSSLDKVELEKMQQNRTKLDKYFNMQPDEILSVSLSRDELPQSDPPDGLISELYPHQRQALYWMLEREKVKPSTLFWQKKGGSWTNSVTNAVVTTPPADCRGGIIGDEMGLGKTLEIISLVIASKNAQVSSGNPPGTTLIVCPLSTLSNWNDQIAKHCARNKLSVYLYHGVGRTSDPNILSTYDIVVTTYNIVGLEFSWNTPTRQQSSPLYTFNWKRVVLDEAHLIKNRTTQQTQAVWDLKAECKWCLTGTPIQNKIDDLYSLLRFIRLDPFTDHIWWNRLITRPIKNKDVTGYSRLKTILQHVILRRTKEKHINLPPRNVCIQILQFTCNGSVMHFKDMQALDFSVEERAYYDSIYRFGKSQFDQYARDGSVLQHYAHVLELLLRLRQTCDHPELVPNSSYTGSANTTSTTATTTTTTTTTSTTANSALPNNPNSNFATNNHPSNINFLLSPTNSNVNNTAYIPANTNGNNNNHINNSSNITSNGTHTNGNVHATPNGNPTPAAAFVTTGEETPKRVVAELINTGELDECCICMDKAIDPVVTKCVHIFCRTCIFRAISLSSNSCPLCRAPVLPRELQAVKVDDVSAVPKARAVTNTKSTKVTALMLDLLSVRQRDPTIKSIIFSQFTTFLNIIERALNEQGIKFVRLDGKMSHEQRNDSIHRFEADPSISVFLLSLKAGGVGLNLVAASRVYMMDPWWNPAVEDQAIDRVHRLGQTRPVEVLRFVIKGTVEEKIMKLQERKMQMAYNALEAKSKSELQHMRLDDLNLLFSND